MPDPEKAASRWFKLHPIWRVPSMVAIIAWIVLTTATGVILIVEAHTNDAIARVHNISACSLSVYLQGTRDRQLAAAADASLSASARARARGSITDLNVLIASQVTYPTHFNCGALLKQLAQGHSA